jgi:hypothetical protein
MPQKGKNKDSMATGEGGQRGREKTSNNKAQYKVKTL